MTLDMKEAALQTLAATPTSLAALLSGAPPALIEQPADGDWSPKDVVAHLIVTGRIGAIERIRAIAERDYPPLQDNDEDEALKKSGLRNMPLEALLDEFSGQRSRDVDWLRALDEASFARAGEHSAVGRVTAEEFLYHAAYHDTLHVAQLARMVGSHFDPLRGPMRVF